MINQRSVSISDYPATQDRKISVDGLTRRTPSNAYQISEEYNKKKSLRYLSEELEKGSSGSSRSEDDVFKALIDDKITKLKYKFWWFAWIASLNHALNYVVTSYASSLLASDLGSIVLGLTWTLNAISGLTVATPIVRGMGFKASMILSLWGYAIQIASLYWAIVTDDVTTAWIVAIAGSSVAGITSAVWWTSQGVYFDDICVAIDEQYSVYQIQRQSSPAPATDAKSISTVDSIRADLSAHWTIIYQSADIIVFLSLSVFPILGAGSIHQVILGLVCLGIATSVLGFTFENVKSNDRQTTWKEIYNGVVAVPRQFKNDARVSLLAPFVFGFGITTAMFAYYVNADVVSDSSSLGTVALGFLEAWSYFVAVISAYPYAYVANRFVRGQDWVIQFGSFCFLLCGVVVIGLSGNQLGNWPVILCVKGLYGLGRGVFEGSCRAVYASMFTGEDLSTAFSGQTLSAGFSGGVCFFLFGVCNQTSISAITIVNGVVALSTYSVLMYSVDPLKRVPWKAICCACNCREKQEQLINATRTTSGLVSGGRATSNRSGLLSSSLHTDEYFDPRSSEGGVSLHEPLLLDKQVNDVYNPTHIQERS